MLQVACSHSLKSCSDVRTEKRWVWRWLRDLVLDGTEMGFLKPHIVIVIVNFWFLERPRKWSRKNQLIHRCLTKTKSIGSGQDGNLGHVWVMYMYEQSERGKERKKERWLMLTIIYNNIYLSNISNSQPMFTSPSTSESLFLKSLRWPLLGTWVLRALYLPTCSPA